MRLLWQVLAQIDGALASPQIFDAGLLFLYFRFEWSHRLLSPRRHRLEVGGDDALEVSVEGR